MKKTIDINEAKLIEIDILKYIKRQCEKNKLTYFLAYGTLLGAVRHKGFIPWDDDIDLLMPLNDYKKLIEIIKKDESSNYIVISPYEGYNNYLFSKVCDKRTRLIEKGVIKVEELGVYVDLFPILSIPGDRAKLDFFEKKDREFVFSMRGGHYMHHNILVKIIKFFVYLPAAIKAKTINWRIRKDALLKEIEKEYNSNEVGYTFFGMKESGKYQKEVFEKGIHLEFENELYNVPIGYEQYLKTTYGDYMKLPPENQRKPKHHFVAYWKNNK